MIRGGSARAMNRLASLTLGLCSAVVLTGCAASLSNPEDFMDGGTAPKSAEMILADSCGTADCHDDAQPAEGLDFLSPNVESRVVDINAIGIGCTGDILVVAGDPDGSYLLDKLLNTPGICGLSMPVVGTLTQGEVATLRQWIIDLGASGASVPDGG